MAEEVERRISESLRGVDGTACAAFALADLATREVLAHRNVADPVATVQASLAAVKALDVARGISASGSGSTAQPAFVQLDGPAGATETGGRFHALYSGKYAHAHANAHKHAHAGSSHGQKLTFRQPVPFVPRGRAAPRLTRVAAECYLVLHQ